MPKWIVISSYSTITLENSMPSEYLLEKGFSKKEINNLIDTRSERDHLESRYLKEKKEGMIIYILPDNYITPLNNLYQKNILTAFSSNSLNSFKTYTPNRYKVWIEIRIITKKLFEVFFRNFMPNIRELYQDENNWRVLDITIEDVCGKCSLIVEKGNLIEYHDEEMGNYFLCEECIIEKQNQKKGNTKFGYIYFLIEYQTGLIKIGKATDVKKRIQTLQIGIPFETEVIFQFHSHDYDLSEKVCHKYFANKKVKGEWFRLTDEEIDWVKLNYNNFII